MNIIPLFSLTTYVLDLKSSLCVPSVLYEGSVSQTFNLDL